ncbi:hypothetical protein LEP1GSC096_0025 [Leptospira interrogans serovar Hebdomadis str. R499]|uniref:hypothetical protein n=1 Tax=Leptospira interrogans TaxID=173 RepID=UPI000297F805|nr:hypothetical protein [Leptospira interrogans]EKR34366.1 hypothetical protein LEP1GSC096_0025 [Leptospira interrogans serovar Hebdomadis str. R499]
MSRNPIKTISTTFSEIMSDLNNDPLTYDAPTWFKVIFAGIFALLTIRLNIGINQVFAGTVSDRDIAADIFRETDYELRWKTTASVWLDITLDPTATSASSYTIPISKMVASTKGGVSAPPVAYEARQALTIPQGQTTGIALFYHQKTRDPIALGQTNNMDAQEFIIREADIIRDTFYLDIGGELYYPQDTLAYSNALDKHFIHKYLSTGESVVTLGFVDEKTGDQYGKIPASGLSVVAHFAVGGGDIGNQPQNTIVKYIGNDPKVISVNNAQKAQGGSEPETLSNAKRMAPLRARTHDMFWDEDSGKVIAKSIPGVLEAQVIITGILRALVYIMPSGGGIAPESLLTSVKNLLISKSIFGQVDLKAYSVNYLYSGFSGKVHMLPGYKFADKLKYISLAVALRTSEIGFYIKDYYYENGISATIDLINTTFVSLIGQTYSEENDFLQVKKLLDNVPCNDFGQSIGPNDISSILMSYVEGVRYVNVTNPFSQITPSYGEIIKPVMINFQEDV